MQIVYISNRPEIFAETLEHVALFMPFIDNALVCVPDLLCEQFQKLDTAFPVLVIAESALLSNKELSGLRGLDHQRRNYLLRSRLVASADVNAEFIMSDDDARPLKSIELNQYHKNNRYRRYFFYDLAFWNSNQTEFDAGQISTCVVLEYENLEHLSYASHMPQIIDKELFIEAADFFKPHAKNHALCEWSTYFNYAACKHPDRFHEPEAFMTLCWPEHPLAWKLFIEPQAYLFENYTPSLYSGNHVFDAQWNKQKNLDEVKAINIEKLIRWRKHAIACKHPEQASSLLKYLNLRTWVNKLTLNH